MKKIFTIMLATVALASCGNTRTGNNNKQKQDNTTMKTIELTKADFLAKVANFETNPSEWKYLGDKPAVIDFYADWCGPCKAVAPIMEELAAEYADSVIIYKVNTEDEQELAAAFGIRSIPSILFVPMDGQPQMAQGAMPKASFKEIIDDVLLKK
jgi:thioredoxin